MSWFPGTDQMDTSQKPRPPANKPTSQKAATMPAEPDMDSVRSLMEVTSMPQDQAVRYLKAKGNDVIRAIGAFFDGEDINKAEQASQWDESVWSAGKDGEYGNEHLRPLASSAAATRPNSPAPSTGARANLHPTSKQQEDDDLAQAMAMSQGDLGAAYQQETGRISADGQQVQFGPATRESYDKSQWAMVPIGVHNTSEIVPDADVEQRMYKPGEPRFLKFLPTGDYTPNLLTICHAIDGAREALLLRGHVQASYGQDAEWWRGHAISLPKIVNVDDGSLADPDTDKFHELLAEVQRLMAFLGASSRSYVSVGALTQSDAFRSGHIANTPSRTLLELFLREWTLAASTKVGPNIAGLFGTRVGTHLPQGNTVPDMNLIDMQVNIAEDSKSDLFEQLDNLLWDNKSDEAAMADNYIDRPAEVLVMRASQQNPTLNRQLRLEVPAEFHVDKYLAENVEATRVTRAHMAEQRKRIQKLDEIERRLTTWRHPATRASLDAQTLLRHTVGHYTGQNRMDALNADKSNTIRAEDMAVDQQHDEVIAEKLRTVVSSIEDKLLTLADERERTRKVIAQLSRAPPSGLSLEDMKHRYTLRGVATKSNITYILCPEDPADATASAEEVLDDDTTPEGMRWWRIEYDTSAGASGARITKSKSADYDVLRAVELEHSSALLVYASDRIATAPALADELLQRPLADFIHTDDGHFAAEIHAERNRPPAYDFAGSINDVYPSNSRTSLDSTRVEGAGSDHGMEDLIDMQPPVYEDADHDYLRDPGFGASPIKQGFHLNEVGAAREVMDEDEVHEIKLDPEQDEGVELIDLDSDSEHAGDGSAGAVHVEDVGK